ncbi:MAG TPA: hypothetical protein VI457_01200 [Methylococcaceae bacterium]|nr:hypothetical protein [Methylococcaceae bacterium]
MKVKAIVAGLALALGATSAQADIVTSPTLGTTAAPSELMLNIHDYTAGRTFVADLGSSFAILRTMTSGLLTWDLGALFGSDFSALGIGSGNNIRYDVVAYSRNTTNTGTLNETSGRNTASFGYMVTSNLAESTLDGFTSTQFLSTMDGGTGPMNAINSRFGAFNALVDPTNNNAVNAAYTTADSSSTVWVPGTWGSNIASKVAGMDTQGTIGTDLAFWFFGAKLSTAGTSDGDAMRLFGNFHLASNGVLTYGSAAPVPVPGAVWLLGSSLLGFIGLGSRKNKAAA